MDFEKYEAKSDAKLKADKIAVIYANGSISSGDGNDDEIGSDRLAKAIREARLDNKIKAIVLRVNSPGGSALASDVIWREVMLAKKVKPTVVSMGNLAASGDIISAVLLTGSLHSQTRSQVLLAFSD